LTLAAFARALCKLPVIDLKRREVPDRRGSIVPDPMETPRRPGDALSRSW